MLSSIVSFKRVLALFVVTVVATAWGAPPVIQWRRTLERRNRARPAQWCRTDPSRQRSRAAG